MLPSLLKTKKPSALNVTDMALFFSCTLPVRIWNVFEISEFEHCFWEKAVILYHALSTLFFHQGPFNAWAKLRRDRCWSHIVSFLVSSVLLKEKNMKV